MAKDLIRHLLVVDPHKRYKAIDVLCHGWILTHGNSKRMDRATLLECQLTRRKELEILSSRYALEYKQFKEREKEKMLEKEKIKIQDMYNKLAQDKVNGSGKEWKSSLPTTGSGSSGMSSAPDSAGAAADRKTLNSHGS